MDDLETNSEEVQQQDVGPSTLQSEDLLLCFHTIEGEQENFQVFVMHILIST